MDDRQVYFRIGALLLFLIHACFTAWQARRMDDLQRRLWQLENLRIYGPLKGRAEKGKQ